MFSKELAFARLKVLRLEIQYICLPPLTLVENMVKKNRSHLFIVILLTTLAAFSFLFYNCNFKILKACNTLLEEYFQDLSSGILKASKFLKLQLVNQKTNL
jgi:hypothetical protein